MGPMKNSVPDQRLFSFGNVGIQQWSDLLTFRVLPVVDDQTMAHVING